LNSEVRVAKPDDLSGEHVTKQSRLPVNKVKPAATSYIGHSGKPTTTEISDFILLLEQC
jgi:hypothetical protein